ncbi:hypothetical protein OG320_14165 [Microbispora sp. NBC_01189]|uniref:hypothetical protein n=1 Tax=Microbispora sp. NBC_01189 TaxID=2903583 RepID=UPI002E10433E|nr:hypothetical protein OG320_14165 [Microbispora sp. NBC_01189]
MRSEADLTAALRQAADGAPEPVDLLAGLGERRRRRTRQRYRTALAVAGVVAVAVGGTTVVRSVGPRATIGDRPATTATTTATTATTPTAKTPIREPEDPAPGKRARPASEVWPQAVFTMPKKTADGFTYRPVTALSPTEILVAAEVSFEKTGRLEVYDLATGTSRVLAEMPLHVEDYFMQGAEAGPHHVVWYGARPNSGEAWADFWAVPVEGGRPVRVGEVTGALSAVAMVGVTDSHVVWSPRTGGVYRLPLAGGTPEKIPGTDGLWLDSWPYATDVLTERWGMPEDGAPGQHLLVNLETGERRTLTMPEGVRALSCHPEWCLGRSGGSLVVVRPDGTGERKLPGRAGDPAIHGDRFVALDGGRGTRMYDIETGRTATIGVGSEDGKNWSVGQGTSFSPSLVYYWNAAPLKERRACRPLQADELKNLPSSPTPGARVCEKNLVEPGNELRVLNLAAIPRE